MRAALAALLVCALLAPLAAVRTANAVTCDGGSADGHVLSPDQINYYYEADTTCPVAIFYVGVASWIEAKQILPPYQDWTRTHDFPDRWDPEFEQARAYVTDQFWVQPFFGSNCRRVVSLHVIIVGAGAMALSWSHSPGKCY